MYGRPLINLLGRLSIIPWANPRTWFITCAPARRIDKSLQALRISHRHTPNRTGVPVTKHRVVQNFTLRESAKSGRHRCQSHGPTANTQCHPTANKISLRGPIPCFEILGHRAHVDPSTSTECGINNEYIRVPHAVVGGHGARRAETFGRAFGILQRTGCSRLAACMSREQNLERGTVLAQFACSQAHKWHTRHRRC